MRFMEANGVSLRYDVAGSGAKTLVLIHEMGGTIESWDLVVPALAASRRVVRYDTRGAGFSEKIRGPLSIDTMTADLVALLDGLGIAGKVALAGTAVGGAIALHTAAQHPDRIAAAVVSSPAVSIPPANRPAVLERVARFEREGVRVVAEQTADSGYPPDLRQDKARFAAFRARWLANDPSSFAAIYRMLAAMDLMPELARIACPVLVLGGEFDRGRPPANAEATAKAIPGAQFKVLPCGHYAALQTPELFVAALEGFLEKSGA